MTLWLVRAGSHGEYEEKFLDEGRIYLTWERLSHDLSRLQERDELRTLLEEVYPDARKGRITSFVGQIWRFVRDIKPGDWVVLPRKHGNPIHVGEVIGDYVSNSGDKDPFFHYREVKWIEQVPRTNFDQDLLYSFGAFMTICEVSRNDAERRVRSMADNGWKSSGILPNLIRESEEDVKDEDAVPKDIDIEEMARDQIARQINARFKGTEMERLVEAVLRAQGYTTYRTPKGRDKGVDVLAASGPMGFGESRICIQVKSSDSPVDLPTLNELRGVMENVQASHGLLVSWGGFKSSTNGDRVARFFNVRFWDQGDIIEQILAHYDNLDEEIRTQLPLKRIWIVAVEGEE